MTERTFFRHFTDKREVPFPDADAVKTAIIGSAGPPTVGPQAAPMPAGAEVMRRFAEVIESRGRSEPAA